MFIEYYSHTQKDKLSLFKKTHRDGPMRLLKYLLKLQELLKILKGLREVSYHTSVWVTWLMVFRGSGGGGTQP